MYYSTKNGGGNILHHYRAIKRSDGIILSIDNVVFNTKLNTLEDGEDLFQLIKRTDSADANITNWKDNKTGRYKENFRVVLRDGNSFWLGVGLNSTKTEWLRVSLDFNPNKVATSPVLVKILSFLKNHSKPMHRQIKRFDLAIDIPVDRMDCFLVKDSRAYTERRHGKEWTQYLGARSSHVGRVKLYNKQIEAKLDFPLTRLELTLSPSTSFEELNFPAVYFVNNEQIIMDELTLKNTERFILNALLQGCGTTKMLGRKTREKMDKVLKNYATQVNISRDEYEEILKQLNDFM